MGDQEVQEVAFELRATSGPTAVSFPLSQPGPVIIGRMSSSDLQLNDPSVSRQHARLTFRPPQDENGLPGGEWLLGDLGSSRGTWLNAVELDQNHQYRLRVGDLIVIGPWTFAVVNPALPVTPGTAQATIADDALVGTVVAPLEPTSSTAALPQQELHLLLECSERIHEARTELDVIQVALDAILAGTDFTRAAFLRPPTGLEVAEVVAMKGIQENEQLPTTFSRTLIQEASAGVPARLQRGPAKPSAADRASDDTVIALCIPVMAGSTLAGFFYLDRPSNDPRRKWTADRAAALPMGLARLAAMGLCNLMRIDVERRQLQMEAEVTFAAAVQRWLLPQREGSFGTWAFVGETRQGKYIRGDFFDVIPLSDDRLAVAVGDVLGRGIPVSVLVSASQGFLYARLQECGDPSEAVTALHRFYRTRVEHSRFAKLWVGILDRQKQKLTYAVAGQVYALVASADGTCTDLSTGKQPLAGTKHTERYEPQTVMMKPDDRLLVVSDGVINQRSREVDEEDQSAGDDRTDVAQAFGIDGVKQCLQATGPQIDEISALFEALVRHSCTELLDDDATALLIKRTDPAR